MNPCEMGPSDQIKYILDAVLKRANIDLYPRDQVQALRQEKLIEKAAANGYPWKLTDKGARWLQEHNGPLNI